MGTKYIIELEDKPFELLNKDGFTSEKLFRVKGFNSLVFNWNGIQKLTPYTESDLEQVRKEAYEAGMNSNAVKIADDKAHEAYQKGLNEAWEAARTIFCTSHGELERIFDLEEDDNGLLWVYHEYTASEAIEKIHAYEEKKKAEEAKKETEIKVEDVMRQYLDIFCDNHLCLHDKCPLHTPEFTCGRGYNFLTPRPVSNEEVRRAYAKVMKENNND